jgi:hypothetical protein
MAFIGVGNEVAWWCPSLDATGNGTTTAYDLVASGINCTLTNGEVGDWTADTSNGGVRCITLDGTNECGTIADDNRFSFGNGTTDSAFSVSCWIYRTVGGVTSGAVAKSSSTTAGEWTVLLGISGAITFRCFDASASARIGRVTATSAITLNTWHNVVVTYSGSATNAGCKIYLNGVQSDNADSGAGSYVAMENGSLAVTIGATGSANYLTGQWDDVRIFNAELNTSQITKLKSRRAYTQNRQRLSIVGV